MYWKVIGRVHPTWHLTAICFGVVLGAGVSFLYEQIIFSSFLWLLAGIMMGLFSLWQTRAFLIVLAVASGMSIGLWRGAVSQSNLEPYKPMYGNAVEITGSMADDVDQKKDGKSVLRLRSIVVDRTQISGEIWVTTRYDTTMIKRSDTIVVEGKLSQGFGSFAAAMYDASIISVTRPVPGDIAVLVRDSFSEKVRDVVREPGASLGIGYLTGQKRSLPDDLQLALQIAGLTHIVVASGYNLTILVRIAKRLFEKVSKYLVAFSSGFLVVCFTFVTGFSPSMMRAGLVTLLSLGVWYIGRKFHPVTLLLFAAAITALINPGYVLGNLGWQLSFAAFAGVMVLAPLLQAYFFGEKKPGFVRQIIGETASAQIATAPIIIMAFGQFSNVALLSNILILPLVPLAMLLTFMTGIIQTIIAPFVPSFAWMTQALLDYMVTVAHWTASVPWAQSKMSIDGWGALVCYVILVAFCYYMWRNSRYSLWSSNIID